MRSNKHGIVAVLFLLCLPLFATTDDIDERIKELREQYLKEKEQAELIKELENKEQLGRVYIRAHQAEQECLKLGIDCKTGKKLPKSGEIKSQEKTIDAQILEIRDAQRLIDAKLAFAKKQADCKVQGLKNCGPSEYTKAADQAKTPSPTRGVVLPEKPQLLGFFNQQALFRVDGSIKAYQTGEEVINHYKVKSILIGRFVVLEHPDSTDEIIVKFTK